MTTAEGVPATTGVVVAPTFTAQQDVAGSSTQSEGGGARQLGPDLPTPRIDIDWERVRGAMVLVMRQMHSLVTLAFLVGFPLPDLEFFGSFCCSYLTPVFLLSLAWQQEMQARDQECRAMVAELASARQGLEDERRSSSSSEKSVTSCVVDSRRLRRSETPPSKSVMQQS